MNIQNSQHIRNKLMKEYNENLLKIDELDDKIYTIYKNCIDQKIIRILAFSLLPYIVSISVSPFIVGFIPLKLILPLCVGIPFSVGIAVEEFFTRKGKLREQLRKFSHSKTHREKIEEVTRYEMEIEKIKNSNKILKKVNDKLEHQEFLIHSLSPNYIIKERETVVKSKEEISKNIENMEKSLAEKQKQLELLTIKQVLKEQILDVRDKYCSQDGMTILAGVGAFVCFLVYDTPIIFIKELMNIQLEISVLEMCAPAIVGALVCTGYGLKMKKDYTDVFANINKELGENAISSDREEEMNNTIENIIEDICSVKLQLEEEKQKLESMTQGSSDELTMNKSIEKLDSLTQSIEQELTTYEEQTLEGESMGQIESYKEKHFIKKRTLEKKQSGVLK